MQLIRYDDQINWSKESLKCLYTTRVTLYCSKSCQWPKKYQFNHLKYSQEPINSHTFYSNASYYTPYHILSTNHLIHRKRDLSGRVHKSTKKPLPSPTSYFPRRRKKKQPFQRYLLNTADNNVEWRTQRKKFQALGSISEVLCNDTRRRTAHSNSYLRIFLYRCDFFTLSHSGSPTPLVQEKSF